MVPHQNGGEEYAISSKTLEIGSSHVPGFVSMFMVCNTYRSLSLFDKIKVEWKILSCASVFLVSRQNRGEEQVKVDGITCKLSELFTPRNNNRPVCYMNQLITLQLSSIIPYDPIIQLFAY